MKRPNVFMWRPPTFYGWRIVVLAAVTLMLTGPGQTLGMSVFVEEIIANLGISRSEVSLAYLIATLAGASMLPLVGRGIDRFGVRAAMTVIGVAFAAAIAGLSGAVGFASMVAGFVGLRMLGQGALTLTAKTAVGLWFEERRGMALGVTTAVGAGLMSLVPVVLTAVVGAVGWRSALLITGPTVGLLVVLIARFGMRDGPHELGLGLDGRSLVSQEQRWGADAELTQAREVSPDAAASREWATGAVMRTVMFWALALSFASPSMIGDRHRSDLPPGLGPRGTGTDAHGSGRCLRALQHGGDGSDVFRRRGGRSDEPADPRQRPDAHAHRRHAPGLLRQRRGCWPCPTSGCWAPPAVPFGCWSRP